jgi:hypothetical protein
MQVPRVTVSILLAGAMLGMASSRAAAQIESPPAQLLPAQAAPGSLADAIKLTAAYDPLPATPESHDTADDDFAPDRHFTPGSNLVSAATWNRSATVAAVPGYAFPSHGASGWDWELLPDGLLFPSYLAGANESRFAITWLHERDDSWLWDVALGGRVGLLRYGGRNGGAVEGVQMDIEGAAMPRLDPEQNLDLVSADFRFGVPLSASIGRWRWKTGYYHLSSHLGDEFLLRTGQTTRLNYSRDSWVLAAAYQATDNLRLYAEADYAFEQDVALPWAFQFGFDYLPACATGIWGAPFFAVNGHLREEIDYSGNVVAQAGWVWRGNTGHIFRTGFHYYNGLSPQFSFYNRFEEQVGVGIWYDY